MEHFESFQTLHCCLKLKLHFGVGSAAKKELLSLYIFKTDHFTFSNLAFHFPKSWESFAFSCLQKSWYDLNVTKGNNNLQFSDKLLWLTGIQQYLHFSFDSSFVASTEIFIIHKICFITFLATYMGKCNIIFKNKL